MRKFLLFIFTTVLLHADTLHIHKGWGMYSFGEEVKDIRSIFGTRSEGVLFTFDGAGWKTFDFSKSTNSFNRIGKNQGFWLNSKNDQFIDGLRNSYQTKLSISEGWNLYGMNGAVTDMFKTFTLQSNILSIWSYIPTCSAWRKNNAKAQEIDTLATYEGFWLQAKKAFTLTINHSSQNLLSSWNVTNNGVSLYTECEEPLSILFNESSKSGSTANTMYLNINGTERAGIPFPSKYTNEKFKVIYKFVTYEGNFANGTVNVRREGL